MFKAKKDEYSIILVYKTDPGSSCDYICRIRYYSAMKDKFRLDPDFLAFDEYSTLNTHLRSLGFMKAGKNKDYDEFALEIWI